MTNETCKCNDEINLSTKQTKYGNAEENAKSHYNVEYNDASLKNLEQLTMITRLSIKLVALLCGGDCIELEKCREGVKDSQMLINAMFSKILQFFFL